MCVPKKREKGPKKRKEKEKEGRSKGARCRQRQRKRKKVHEARYLLVCFFFSLGCTRTISCTLLLAGHSYVSFLSPSIAGPYANLSLAPSYGIAI